MWGVRREESGELPIIKMLNTGKEANVGDGKRREID